MVELNKVVNQELVFHKQNHNEKNYFYCRNGWFPSFASYHLSLEDGRVGRVRYFQNLLMALVNGYSAASGERLLQII